MSTARNEKDAKRLQKFLDQQQAALKESLRVTMQSEHGRRVLASLIADCGVEMSVYANSGSLMYYNAGKQDVGHKLRDLLMETTPEAYAVLQREQYRARLDLRSQPAAGSQPSGDEGGAEE